MGVVSRRAVGLWGSLGVLALGCQTLEPIPLEQCGNGVLERGEDCDSQVDASLGASLACAQHGTDHECRYVCGPQSGCPEGWGCGDDGVCRSDSGSFAPTLAISDWVPQSLAVADLDGDRSPELVGAFANRLEIVRFDPIVGAGAPRVLGSLPATGPIAAADLDADGLADVLLPSSEGVSIWRGQPSGEPLAMAYATTTIPTDALWPIPAAHDDFPRGLLLALYDLGSLRGRAIDWNEQEEKPTAILHQRLRLADLAGERLAMARFPLEEGDTFALPFLGTSEVQTRRIAVSTGNGQLTLLVRDAVALAPLGLTVAGGALFADVDGDDRLDLLIHTTGPEHRQGTVAVARGQADDGLGPAAIDDRFAVLAAARQPAQGGQEPGPWPLASGDLDGDGRADFIGAEGVYLAQPQPPHALVLAQARKCLAPWAAATVTDVDGDGSLDVVAVCGGEPQIEVLRCGARCADGQRFANVFPLARPAAAVRAGHLRGTPAADLVLLSRGAAGDLVTVLPGRLGDWPGAPQDAASLLHVERLEIGRAVRAVAAGEVDRFEDVWVMTRTSSGTTNFGLLHSDAVGQLTSAFGLQTSFYDEYSAGRAALVGALSGPAPTLPDALFLGESDSGEPRLWWAMGAEGAALTPTGRHLMLREVLGHAFSLACSRLTLGDLEGEGQAELVVAFGDGICGTGAIELAVGRMIDGELVLERVGPQFEGEGGVLVVTDLDGEQGDEVIIATTGRAHVLRDLSGPGDASQAFTLPDGERPLDATIIARSPGATGPRRVALLTSASLLLLDGSSPTHLASVTAEAVRSADLDRDGLGDLLLQTPRGVEPWLATPAEPLGGAP